MTHMFFNELELRRLMHDAQDYEVHRNYDIEWDFIKQMDQVAEMKMPFNMIILIWDTVWVGVDLIERTYTAHNDN